VALSLGAATAQAGNHVLVEFSGGIGVDPLTGAGGVDVVNTVRGVAPGGRAWVIRKLEATVFADGTIVAKGKGVLLASGESIGTRGAVTHVAATLACGPADATALKATTAPSPLDAAGNFSIRAPLSADGINTVVLPATCDNPVLFIRNANPTTGAAGGWFAVGIPGHHDD
jgi:hypothetical protein